MTICIDQTVMLNGKIIRCDMTDAIQALDPFQCTQPAWRMEVPVPKAVIAANEPTPTPNDVNKGEASWTVCRCSHIAQEHAKDHSCEECDCKQYTGKIVWKRR